MTTKDLEIQTDSVLIRRYRSGKCYAVRFAEGTPADSIITVGNEFGYDYEPFDESSGQFIHGKTRHIKG